MDLTQATWTEVRDAAPDAALLPVGSTEQHGPHAPLGTDALTAVAVAEAAADLAGGGELVVAPPVHVGVSREHREFAGTLWVSPDTFRAYVRETVESLAFHGVDRVVLVNGHGGNVEALAEVAREASRDDATDAYAVAFTWFEAAGEHAADMGHGGKLETALLRRVAPDLVREDRVEAARDGGSSRWGEWVRGVNLAHDSHEFTDNGVVGDPSAGDAELGAELLERASEALAAVTDAVRERDRNRTGRPGRSE